MRVKISESVALILGLVLAVTACASSKPKTPSESRAGKGFREVDAVVSEREFEPTSMGAAGSGTYYLGFEAKDGEATVHYRFPVTRAQYNRFPEGTHVQLMMADDRLRDIRPAS